MFTVKLPLGPPVNAGVPPVTHIWYLPRSACGSKRAFPDRQSACPHWEDVPVNQKFIELPVSRKPTELAGVEDSVTWGETALAHAPDAARVRSARHAVAKASFFILVLLS